MGIFKKLFASSESVASPVAWATCTNPRFGFEFQYPRGWESVPGIPSIVYHPPDARTFEISAGGKRERVYSPALTLMMMPRGQTAGQSPDAVFQGFKQLLPRFFPGFAAGGEKTVSLASGQSGFEIRFDFLKGDQPYHAVLLYVVQPQFIFIFDASSLRPSFPEHEATLLYALHSLRLD